MKKLRKYRREKGYSQAELAELVGVDQSMVSRWETGINEANAAQAAALMRIFERPEAELFAEDTDES